MKSLNEHESEIARSERLHELYGDDARERAVALCFRHNSLRTPNVDTLLEEFWDCPEQAFANYGDFREAVAGKSHEVLGLLFVDALDKLAHEWLETPEDQELVSTLVHQLAEDEV